MYNLNSTKKIWHSPLGWVLIFIPAKAHIPRVLSIGPCQSLVLFTKNGKNL